MRRRHLMLCAPGLLLAGCAAMPARDALRVNVVALDAMESEALELRLLCKLRVQNPNDVVIEYRGVAIDMLVRGQPFASGVSEAAGMVPAYGETLVFLPVTVPALNIARMAFGLIREDGPRRLDYLVRGKFGGGLFPWRFEASGTIDFLEDGGIRVPSERT
jgi:LEA14-like dessication related protein